MPNFKLNWNKWEELHKLQVHLHEGDDNIAVKVIPTSLKRDAAFVVLEMKDRNKKKRLIASIYLDQLSMTEDLYKQLGEAIEKIKTLNKERQV